MRSAWAFNCLLLTVLAVSGCDNSLPRSDDADRADARPVVELVRHTARGCGETPVALAIDAAGNQFLAVLITTGGTSRFGLRHRVADEAWSPVEHVATTRVGEAGKMLMAPLPDGGLRLVWFADEAIFTRTRAASGSWTPITQISDSGILGGDPDQGVSSSGSGMVAWVQRGAGLFEGSVVAVASDGRGIWADPVPLTGAGVMAMDPIVTDLDAETMRVTWVQREPNGALSVRTRAFDGDWGEVVTVSSPRTTSALPAVTSDGRGNTTFAWPEEAAGDLAVRVATLDGAGGWSDPAEFPAEPGRFSGSVAIASGADGTTYLAYTYLSRRPTAPTLGLAVRPPDEPWRAVAAPLGDVPGAIETGRVLLVAGSAPAAVVAWSDIGDRPGFLAPLNSDGFGDPVELPFGPGGLAADATGNLTLFGTTMTDSEGPDIEGTCRARTADAIVAVEESNGA